MVSSSCLKSAVESKRATWATTPGVTRGQLMIECQIAGVSVRYECPSEWQSVSTRNEVTGTRKAVSPVRGTVSVLLTNQECDTCPRALSVRGRHVSVRGQTMAIMRQLVERKKTKIPLDPAI
ncbi:hypothetical protein Tco_1564196 [Tanacetum coccineum]